DSDPHQEEIDIITSTDDVLPPSVENDDSDGEEVAVVDLRDNPSIPRPPPEPPDAETDIGDEIPVVMNDKDKDVDYSSFMFAKVFSLLFVESEDTIFDLDFVESSPLEIPDFQTFPKDN
nr:hypothetical protein [Tanacetum cinerariifolium]